MTPRFKIGETVWFWPHEDDGEAVSMTVEGILTQREKSGRLSIIYISDRIGVDTFEFEQFCHDDAAYRTKEEAEEEHRSEEGGGDESEDEH